jgi:hypothetical protein
MDDVHAVHARDFVGQRAGAVGRIVVDDHQLQADAFGRARGKQGLDEFGDPITLVIGGQHHGEVGPLGARCPRDIHGCTIIHSICPPHDG